MTIHLFIFVWTSGIDADLCVPGFMEDLRVLVSSAPGRSFTNSDGPSGGTTDRCPILFVQSRLVRRPVGRSVALTYFSTNCGYYDN